MLKYQDAPTIQGYIGALLGTQHPDQRITDVVNLTVNKVNHHNGRTPINPRLTYPLQYMDPEYHHTTYKHLTVGLNHSRE